MGQVAREHGFSAKSLAALCEPAAGLAIGCAVFAAKLRASANGVHRALTLWNGGANANYSAQVLARLAKYRKSESRITLHRSLITHIKGAHNANPPRTPVSPHETRHSRLHRARRALRH